MEHNVAESSADPNSHQDSDSDIYALVGLHISNDRPANEILLDIKKLNVQAIKHVLLVAGGFDIRIIIGKEVVNRTDFYRILNQVKQIDGVVSTNSEIVIFDSDNPGNPGNPESKTSDQKRKSKIRQNLAQMGATTSFFGGLLTASIALITSNYLMAIILGVLMAGSSYIIIAVLGAISHILKR